MAKLKDDATKLLKSLPKDGFIKGDSPAQIPNWKIIDSPNRPDCVESDEGIEISTTKDGIKFVRTPEERFENLKDFPFEPHYAFIEGLRMHYIDEGPVSGQLILMLHGQPTWSYLYRKMIPILSEAGFRVIAPDHIGMGRSDKPIDLSFHTYELHIARMKKLISGLKLRDITLFCQDWGGLMGLRIVGDQPESFLYQLYRQQRRMVCVTVPFAFGKEPACYPLFPGHTGHSEQHITLAGIQMERGDRLSALNRISKRGRVCQAEEGERFRNQT